LSFLGLNERENTRMQHEQCNLRLPPEARARLRKLATQTRRTPSAVIEILLSRAVALDEPDIALVDAAEGAPKDAS
jgi:predicted transcriptional regulator